LRLKVGENPSTKRPEALRIGTRPGERDKQPMPDGTHEQNLTHGEIKILALQNGLPESLFQKAVWQLLMGYPVGFTTNWILDQTEHNQLRDWRFETLHPYMSALGARIHGFRSYPKVEHAPPWLRNALDGLK
jgi:hypothetical protein